VFIININKEISKLIKYAVDNKMIESDDEVYAINRILSLLKLNEFKKYEINDEIILFEILDNIINYSLEKNIIEKDIIALKDIFDSELMNVFIRRPSEINKCFYKLHKNNSEDATNWFYKLNKDSNYIRTNRIKKNVKWKTKSVYGDMDITINLSKPEKTPEEIIMASKIVSSNYPKCFLCKENEGYSGRVDHPGRANHRIIKLNLIEEKWFFQYSPYSYFNEHAIVLKSEHEPMKICLETYERLLDFIEMFPHYFLGSNADLPIVGGSILSHDHFQGGRYEFTIEKAKKIYSTNLKNYKEIDLSIIDWPMSVIRISGNKKNELSKLAWEITKMWKNYSDESVDILSKTIDEHNTITPIARYKNKKFEIDLVLRNNRTTKEFPMGIFHPHNDVHHIKKENIGLIEVMGLAVLPKRLKKEISEIVEILLNNKKINENLKHHEKWINKMKKKYIFENEKETIKIIESEIGLIFVKVLEYAGVYKRNAEGFDAFKKFVSSLCNIK
jgi:UDPglucose--hexose-1-phosphate uridylyltransferase